MFLLFSEAFAALGEADECYKHENRYQDDNYVKHTNPPHLVG